MLTKHAYFGVLRGFGVQHSHVKCRISVNLWSLKVKPGCFEADCKLFLKKASPSKNQHSLGLIFVAKILFRSINCTLLLIGLTLTKDGK